MKREQLAFKTALDHVLTERGYGSAAQISRHSGIPGSTICDLRNGKKHGTVKTLSAIAEAAGYTYVEFMQMGMSLLDKEGGYRLAPEGKLIEAELLIGRMRGELELKEELIKMQRRVIELLEKQVVEEAGFHQTNVGP